MDQKPFWDKVTWSSWRYSPINFIGHKAFLVQFINFIPCQEVEQKEGTHFFQETWSVNDEWYWDIAFWSCVDTLYFRVRAEKMFCMKILLILPKFHERTLSRSWDIKIFRPERSEWMNTLFLSPLHIWFVLEAAEAATRSVL